MFIYNKYTNIYFRIIEKAKSLNRKKSKENIYESHHIYPKCFGGSNRKFNKVLLTPKEHYICHLLLIKMTEGTYKAKMYSAFKFKMNPSTKHPYRYTSNLYEAHKKNFIYMMHGENNPNYGNKWSDEKKNALSEYFKKNRSYIGINNPAFNNPRLDLIQRNKLPKAWVTNDIEDKLILRKNLPTYISKGYRIGRTQQIFKAHS